MIHTETSSLPWTGLLPSYRILTFYMVIKVSKCVFHLNRSGTGLIVSYFDDSFDDSFDSEVDIIK